MEENLHKKDNLDDFVQKSFEEYEELPSLDMWGRIEDALDASSEAPQRPALKSRWFGGPSNRWWAVAAAVFFVVVGWAGIYTYYENKISALETSISKTQPAPQEKLSPQMDSLVAQKVEAMMAAQQQMEEGHNAGQPDAATEAENKFLEQKNNQPELFPSTDIRKNTTSNLSVVPEKYATGKQSDNPKRLQPSETPSIPNKIEKSAIKPDHTPEIAGQNTTITNQIIATTTNPTNDVNAIIPGITDIATTNSDVRIPTGTETPTMVSAPATMQQVLAALQHKKMEALPTALPTANAPALLPPVIRPHRSGSDWYAGLRCTPSIAKENAAAKPAKPIERPFGGPFPQKNAAFVNDTSRIGQTLEWGLTLGKKINRHLAFETGLSFADFTQESVHHAKFEFRDGRFHSGPGGGHGGPRFDFDYNLNTYSGSAAVSLRMEQVDNTHQVSQTEPLEIKITTKQHTKVVKVPLLAAFSLGRGRLQGVVKAGPEAQFNISNQLEVDVLASLNDKFKLEDGGKPHPVFETNRRFSLGYRASAGLEYRLLKQLSIVAEPMISGTFAQTDNLKQELPGLFTAGVNFGINYHF
jgi:hypothetical protein